MSTLTSILVVISLMVCSISAQTFRYEISGPRKTCLDEEKIRKGDRLTVLAEGFLGDGTKFYDNDTIEFDLGAADTPVPLGWVRGLTKKICPGDKVVMILDTPQLRFHPDRRPDNVPEEETLYTIVIVISSVRLPKAFKSAEGSGASGGLNVHVQRPRDCTKGDQVKLGDRLIVHTRGFLEDQTVFADNTVDFVLGSDATSDVVAGWEEGLVGKCAGEKVEMVIPPELGYGNRRQGKVPAGSTIISVVTINAIIRVTEPPPSRCHANLKAQPNLDITMELEGRVLKANKKSSRGDLFIERQLEVRYGKADVKGLQKGLEIGLTGACTDEKRLLLLGPALAYGSEGNRAYQNGRIRGAVPPEAVVRVEAKIVRVRNKKPEGNLDLQFLNQLANGNARVPSGRK